MNGLELLSAVLGVTGTLLLAVRSRYAGWAFVAYLISNIGWITFGAIHSHWGLLAQHVVFSLTSLIGIWTWLLKPRWTAWRQSGRVTVLEQMQPGCAKP